MLSIFLSRRNKKDTVLAFMCYVYICVIHIEINVLMYFTGVSAEQLKTDWMKYILYNTPTLLIIAAATVLRIIMHKYIMYSAIKENIVLLLVGGISIAFYLTFLQLFAFSDTSKKNIRIAAVAVSLRSIILMIVFVQLIKSSFIKSKLKTENEAMNRMLETQKDYYLMLLKNEEETRAFRHDFRNHIFCLNSLYRDGRYNEFEYYLYSLSEKYKELKCGETTGNSLIDTIMNGLRWKYSKVNFEKIGYITEELLLSPFDICTIFSNILQNEFETADKTDEKKVSLFIGIKNSSLLIKLKNSALASSVVKDNSRVSDKKGEGHG